MKRAIALLFLTGVAHADGSFAQPSSAEVSAIPTQAVLRLVLDLTRHHGCSLSYETVQQRSELVLEVDHGRAELRMSGSEREVSGGRAGVNDGPPRVYRDETRALAVRLKGTAKREGDALDVKFEQGGREVGFTCRLERLERGDAAGQSARALVCASPPEKPLGLGRISRLPRLPFGKGNGYQLQTLADRFDDAPVKVALASR
jgi:hypothetical protein